MSHQVEEGDKEYCNESKVSEWVYDIRRLYYYNNNFINGNLANSFLQNKMEVNKEETVTGKMTYLYIVKGRGIF